MVRMLRTALVAAVLAAGHAAAQAPPPRFDVVSVKRNRSGDSNSSTRVRPGGGLLVTNNTLRGLIRNAFTREDFQIAGGPAWIDTDRFDIVATGSQDASFDVMVAKVKTLLADRFGLMAHVEMREMPVYALTAVRADRLGPNIRASAVDCRPTATNAAKPQPVTPPGLPPGEQPICGLRRRQGFVGIGGATMTEFALGLSGIVSRTVIDRSGLAGTHDLSLTWDPDLAGGQGVSLFTAVQEQLGLKLEPQRAPVEVLVIDRAEPPTED
jgi:uncharacterized protein (TIGR03435 family)